MPRHVRNSRTQPASQRDIVPGFAQMLLSARTQLGWNLSRLAQEAGVSLTTACDVEREQRAPSLRVAMQLVAALGVNVLLADPSDPKKVDELVASGVAKSQQIPAL